MNKLRQIALLCGIAIALTVAIGGYAVTHSASAKSGWRTVNPNGIFNAAGIPTTSGIENIYIVKTGQNYAANFSGLGTDNVLATITASGGSVNIPYNTSFAIVVAVKGSSENMAYVQVENLKVELAASGAFTITQENSANENEHIFASGSGYIRVNVVWDNSTNYYKEAPSGSLSLNPVRLWLWS